MAQILCGSTRTAAGRLILNRSKIVLLSLHPTRSPSFQLALSPRPADKYCPRLPLARWRSAAAVSTYARACVYEVPGTTTWTRIHVSTPTSSDAWGRAHMQHVLAGVHQLPPPPSALRLRACRLRPTSAPSSLLPPRQLRCQHTCRLRRECSLCSRHE